MKNLRNIGIVAHVDAGKTTLTEQMLYLSGKVRILGSVDQGSSIMDWSNVERERGITVFAEQAVIPWKGVEINLLDTPGHLDFAPELERALKALDGAILVISAVEGIQSHTENIWQLLREYRIPTLFFINKLDRLGADPRRVCQDLEEKLTKNWIPLQWTNQVEKALSGLTNLLEMEAPDLEENLRQLRRELIERLVAQDENLFEHYLAGRDISRKVLYETLRGLTAEEQVFPLLMGSAMKGIGVQELLDAVVDFLPPPTGQEEGPFEAVVYKVRIDEGSGQLSSIRVLNGRIKVRDSVYSKQGIEEKISQIRKYTGRRYEMVQELGPGEIAVFCGLKTVKAGELLTQEYSLSDRETQRQTVLSFTPILIAQVTTRNPAEFPELLQALQILEKEDPTLHLEYEVEARSFQVQLMGLVQIEVLREILKERFGVQAEFAEPHVNYLETISGVSQGFCHFEPKKHYAEVEVELEPLDCGQGIEFVSRVSQDHLPLQYQVAIKKAIPEALSRGVLMGSPVTDLRVKLIAGKFHLEHTHGGDFRIATIRALQQALEKNNGLLLEPFYVYSIRVNSEFVGRVMSDILRMDGSFNEPIQEEERSILTGKIPVATSMDYAIDLASVTSGKARISLRFSGYERCHNEAEILEALGPLDMQSEFSEEDLVHNSISLFREKRKMKKVKSTEEF